jgi:myosin-heavy-chain kinase
MAVSATERTLEKYESFLLCHNAATYLATQFNAVKPSDCDSIQFCDACLLHLSDRPDQPCYLIQEERLTGHFEKYNSNAGMCMTSPTAGGTVHHAIQTFSHWTYHVTEGQLMVVDCQGVYSTATQTFTLTDLTDV